LITVVAIMSVVSGIHYGIKIIAITAFCLANFIWLMVFTMDDPVYFLDIAVQTLGHYLQYFLELGFQTDAFQRQYQHGHAGTQYTDRVAKPDYLFSGAPADTYGNSAFKGGNPKFMQWWTIFYWGWWIAWSPFVGLFIARISKGRTIRQVFNYSMTAPLLYIIMWFAVFGGAGIKMHNTALECKNQDVWELDPGGVFAEEYKYTVCCPTQAKGRTDAWAITKFAGNYNEAAYPDGILTQANRGAFCDYAVTGNLDSTLTSDERDFLTTASISDDDSRRIVYEFKYATANFFEVLEQYYGWGDFLSGVTIATIILYFVTSSDSGSLVVDLISAGGHKSKDGEERDPHWLQRVLWSLTEGALAIGLMRTGAEATSALQAMSVAVGLPFTIVLMFQMPALYRMLKIDDGKTTVGAYGWKMPIYGGFFDVLEYVFSLGGLVGGSPSVDDLKTSFVQFLMGLLPFIHVQMVLQALDVDGKSKIENMVLIAVVFGLWILWVVSLAIEDHEAEGWYAFANAVYTIMALVLTCIRGRVRKAKGIDGTMVEDFLCCFVMYFNVGPQLWAEVGPDTAVRPVSETKPQSETKA